jgi:mono/diheme cytochrome c family protein
MSFDRTPKLAWVAGSTLVFLALYACGGGGSSDPTAPDAEPAVPLADAPASEKSAPTEVEPEGLSAALNTMLSGISAQDRAKTNPLSGQAEVITEGRSEYMSMCFVCHGAQGKGDGPAAKATPSTPSNLADAGRAALLSDGDRFAVMRNGIPGTSMPASGANLNDEQIWRILAYVQTLSKQ